MTQATLSKRLCQQIITSLLALFLVCFLSSWIAFKEDYLLRAWNLFFCSREANALRLYTDEKVDGWPVEFGHEGISDGYVTVGIFPDVTPSVKKVLKEKFLDSPWVLYKKATILWD